MPEMELKVYYQVPIEILEDRDQLLQWAKDAVAVAGAPKRRKTKRDNR